MNSFHRWFCRSGVWKAALTEKIVPWAMTGIELGDDVLEVGPGPGLTTDILRDRHRFVTAIEIDQSLAASLKQRLRDTNVTVVEGDATRMPFSDGAFSGAVSFAMLHHVPSSVLQDRLLAEVFRVLRPGGIFAGTDSRWTLGGRLIHLGDVMVLIDPDTFGSRLEAAGFREVSVEAVKRAFRFSARRPRRVDEMPKPAKPSLRHSLWLSTYRRAS